MTLAFWLSIVLACAGCAGLLLAGSGRRVGWAIGIAVQPVWIAFGVITGGYGLCLTAIMYAAVYTRNLLRWTAAAEPAPGRPDIEIVGDIGDIRGPFIIRGPRDALARISIDNGGQTRKLLP